MSVERSDIEQKLRQIQSEIDEAAGSARPAGLALGASLLVGSLGLAFLLGQRKSRKETTIVEIRRA